MSALPAPLVSLWGAPLVSMALTFVIYHFASVVHRRFDSHPLLNPIPVSIAVIIGLLLATKTDYEQYFAGAQFLHFLLGPAVVALAIPLYTQWSRLRAMALPIAGTLLIGSATGVICAIGFTRVLAPKSTGHVRPDFMRVLIGIR